jgi:hypothetical protein
MPASYRAHRRIHIYGIQAGLRIHAGKQPRRAVSGARAELEQVPPRLRRCKYGQQSSDLAVGSHVEVESARFAQNAFDSVWRAYDVIVH